MSRDYVSEFVLSLVAQSYPAYNHKLRINGINYALLQSLACDYNYISNITIYLYKGYIEWNFIHSRKAKKDDEMIMK